MLPPDPTPGHRLVLADFVKAQGMIHPAFLNSPQYDREALSEVLGCSLTLKVETTNPIRSIKGRGANYLIQTLPSCENPSLV